MRKYSRLMCMTEAYGTVMKIDEANIFTPFKMVFNYKPVILFQETMI